MIKKILLLLFITSLGSVNAQLTPPSELQSYYNNVDFSLTGTQLFNDLAAETISKHTNILEYGQRHNYLYNADEDLANNANVILMYSGESRDEREYESASNSHQTQTFNTEHVYPQSLIINNAKGDLHHLRTCDISINSDRGSRKFIEGSGNYGVVDSSWYPGDDWKGDVARMIMYLNLRYNESFSDIGTLNLFLKWNAEDPVVDGGLEDVRNTYHGNTDNDYAQGNRNPFIDNPYLATVIWGGPDAQNRWEDLSVVDVEKNDVKLFPNPVNGNEVTIISNTSIIAEVYDILGKKVKVQTITPEQKTLNISGLSKGIYLVRLNSEVGSQTKRLIKQ
jgi:endonuclease I